MLRLRTFGGLALLADDGPVEGAGAQRRRLALLALLDAAGERGLSREKLLAYLWTESEPEKGRGSLAQALYSLRKVLGDDAFDGSNEVRVNPGRLASDRGDFLAAIAAGRLEDAVALYPGSYLDGFFLIDSVEFERWAERERASLSRAYTSALHQLARAETDSTRAADWWRRLCIVDPMSAKYAIGLMRALVAAGDRPGAIQHARVYEAFVQQELGAPGDPDVRALAEELKLAPPAAQTPLEASPAPPTPLNPVPTPTRAPAIELADNMSTGEVVAVAMSRLQRSRTMATVDAAARVLSAPLPQPAPAIAPRAGMRRFRAVAFAAAAVALVAIGAFVRGRGATRPPVPTVAVGHFRDYTRRGAELSQPLTDMLATNLARAPGLQVVSTARMLELMAHDGANRDTSAATMTAARQAGATQLIDGAVYARDKGGYRLDLRTTDIASGKVLDSYTAENADLFALVEGVTKQVTTRLGLSGPATPLADVMTHSIVAYRLYEEGLRARAVGRAGALELFRAALKEDSTFAMAAYNAALITGSADDYERAMRLAAHTSDRERLLITAHWAQVTNQPLQTVHAESLVARYPSELEGYVALGEARFSDAEYDRAIPPLQHVVHLDTSSLRTDPRDPSAPPRCSACRALSTMGAVYKFVDSFPAAERMYKSWIAVQAGSIHAWGGLGELYYLNDQFDKALVTTQTTAAVAPQIDQTPFHMMIRIRSGDFAQADEYWARQSREGNLDQKLEALGWMVRSFRSQGRLADALEAAHRARILEPTKLPERSPWSDVAEGIVLLESGQYRASAALFDSIARRPRRTNASVEASDRLWGILLRACALAAAHDTTLLGRLADSAETLGRVTIHRTAHRHIRGLLWQARGRLTEAEQEYRAAIWSSTNGFTQSNMRLAEVFMATNRPREAAIVLGSALRGQEFGTSGMSNRTTIHEAIARAFDVAGIRDSALVHYDHVARAWSNADAMLLPRRDSVRARVASLSASGSAR